MGLIRRYQYYKYLLTITLVLNAFFILLGIVALKRWLDLHEPTQGEMIFVSLGVMVFGIILPVVIFGKINSKLIELRAQTQEIVAKYVSQWVDSLKEYDGEEALQNPQFWLNMGLLVLEVAGDSSKHPGLQAVAEIAPMIRREIKKRK